MKVNTVLALIWAGVLAGAALACVKPATPALGVTETGPCGGCNANWYTICPQDDSCPGGDFLGFETCTTTFVTVACSDFQGGYLGSSGCCTGGTFSRASSTTTSRMVQTGAGVCSFWVLPW